MPLPLCCKRVSSTDDILFLMISWGSSSKVNHELIEESKLGRGILKFQQESSESHSIPFPLLPESIYINTQFLVKKKKIHITHIALKYIWNLSQYEFKISPKDTLSRHPHLHVDLQGSKSTVTDFEASILSQVLYWCGWHSETKINYQ